jgi:PilZ domain-containing protein
MYSPQKPSGDEPQRRRSGRILVSLPIQVIGQDASGRTFVEEGVTVLCSQHGGRISLTRSLMPDEIVLIKNLQNGIEEEFRVVGGFEEVIGGRREWGVEALDPKSKVWGMEFVPPEAEDQLKALIECAACKRAALSPLSSIEYDLLLATGMISRHCDRCDETTRWKPSEQHLTPEIIAAGSRLAAVENEKRKAKRRPLSVHIQVRGSRGASFAAETRDVSQTGLSFTATQPFEVGDEVHISFPFSDRHAPLERVGKIAWAAMRANVRVYGVSFVK